MSLVKSLPSLLDTCTELLPSVLDDASIWRVSQILDISVYFCFSLSLSYVALPFN